VLSMRVEGDKVFIEGLDRFAAGGLQAARQRAARRIGSGVFNAAHQWLSGPGGASKKVRTDYVGFTKKSGEDVMFRSYKGAGAYPVPVRSGNLRNHLDWLMPGQSKAGVTAAHNEIIIFDSAEYARRISEGTGSSAKFGPRPFLIDGFNTFNRGGKAVGIVEEEIGKELPGR
jgi:hypothetical protein